MRKASKIMIFVLVVLSITEITVLFRENRASRDREIIAQSWSSDELQVFATGPLNQTMSVTSTEIDSAKCQMFVVEVLADRKLSGEIKAYGFTSIRCGSIAADLTQ